MLESVMEVPLSDRKTSATEGPESRKIHAPELPESGKKRDPAAKVVNGRTLDLGALGEGALAR